MISLKLADLTIKGWKAFIGTEPFSFLSRDVLGSYSVRTETLPILEIAYLPLW